MTTPAMLVAARPTGSLLWDRVRSLPWGMLALLVAYRLVARCYFKYMRLPEECYGQAVILVECLKHPITAAMLLLPTAWGCWHFRRLSWKQLENGAPVRWFVGFLCLVVAYAFSTYDYNHYFDQAHAVDRVLLLVAAVLTVWHPAFVSFFLGLSVAIIAQFNIPLASYPWTDKKVLLCALMLFQVFLFSSLWRKWNCVEFVFVLVCLQAANYFYPGVEKLRIGWLLEENVADLSKSAYLNGWLSFIDQISYFRLVDQLAWLNGPLVAATLALELSALVVLWRRSLAYVVFGGCALMHVGIFLAAGILFWMWVAFDVALLVLLATLPAACRNELFRRRNAAWGAVLIAASPLIFQPEKLAWHSTPLNTFYQLEAVGQSGQVYQVSNSFLSPYDFTFCLSRFGYLTNEKVVVGTIGSTVDARVKHELANAATVAEIREVEERRGAVQYDERSTLRFDHFVQRYFASVNNLQGKCHSPCWGVPHHIWHFDRGHPFHGQEPVLQVRVRLLKLRHRNDGIDVVADCVVRTIDIPHVTVAALNSKIVR